VGAYWTAAVALMAGDLTRLPENISYLAFDFSEIESEDREALSEIAEGYCEDNGYTFLEGTMDELIDQGYITTWRNGDNTFPEAFEGGALVSLETISVSETEIVISGSIWQGNLAAVGANYTVTYKNGEWTASSSDFWIS
jgi:hypothetical protein